MCISGVMLQPIVLPIGTCLLPMGTRLLQMEAQDDGIGVGRHLLYKRTPDKL
jgi:hypothetical protein